MKNLFATAVIATAAMAATLPANASLVLTAAGVAEGFTLSAVISGGNDSNYPALAGAVLSDGKLAVLDYEHGRLVKYNDTDNQTQADALAFVNFSGAINIANVGGKTYATSTSQGLFEVSSALGLTHINTPGVSPSLGLWGNTATGHLLMAASTGLVDVNPLTGTSTLIASGFFDGVSVSPDGTVVYAEFGGTTIRGYNILSHLLVSTYSFGHAPDGTGVISGGALNGHIISNNNDGTVVIIDPSTSLAVVIASGGSRGDFTSADSNDGSLLLSQYGAMLRLKVAGGSIGGTVPEPMSLALVAVALLGIGVTRRRTN